MVSLQGGAASIDITPSDSQFLFGYPHVARYSTGVHDRLLSSALCLSDGRTQVMFIGNDIIFVPRELALRARRRIEQATGVASGNIMITATHTHSGPKTMDHLSNEDDPLVPRTDPAYLSVFEQGIVDAGITAWRNSRPVRVGLVVAEVTGVGTNRRDPDGPRDPQVPVLLVESSDGIVACMLVYSMHPTVLREGSTLVSADFPGMARRFLQQNVLGESCPVIYHTGPAGNQSVRYSVQANTFAEAERLGDLLGRAVAQVVPEVRYVSEASLGALQAFVDLPRRAFPSVTEASRLLEVAADRLAQLRRTGAPRQEIRLAEVNWFGGEETVTLARAAQEGRLEAVYRSCQPAEVQVLKVGPWAFVGWPGEVFVEYGLSVKKSSRDTFIISLANGELHGYVATEQAGREGGYEAWNTIFEPGSGTVLADTALDLLNRLAR
jgi:neutral ceramidase